MIKRVFHHYTPRSGTAGAASDQRFEQLLRIMESERPYLNGQLMQDEIADRLGISKRTLSRMLDRQAGCNFNHFINGYRLREAKRLMRNRQYDRLSIEQIGRKSGFNTRSVFHRVFRERMNCTPARYRTRLR